MKNFTHRKPIKTFKNGKWIKWNGKKLNKLIDIIEEIENSAYWQGAWIEEPNRQIYYNKKLARAKTRAFKLIDLLIKSEK